MKIKEFILVPSKSQDTTSCGTTSCVQKEESAQDIVSQDIVEKNRLTTIDEHPDHSAMAE